MKKIVLLMFGLLFAGVFAFADTGVGGRGGSLLVKVSIGEGGNLLAPSEIFEAKATAKEAEIPMYSKHGFRGNSLDIIAFNKFYIAPCLANCKKVEVGWQGYTDA